MNARVGVVILAAGESTRMGAPKQFVEFRGKSLVRHAVDVAMGSKCRPIVVVVGGNAEAVKMEIPDVARLVRNANWAEGMGTSIACGVAAIEDEADAVVLALCDQPLVTSDILNELTAFAGEGLAAAEYDGTIGVPALFGKQFFPELMALSGKEGAKKFLLRNAANVRRVKCPEAGMDIDTAEDIARLRTIE